MPRTLRKLANHCLGWVYAAEKTENGHEIGCVRGGAKTKNGKKKGLNRKAAKKFVTKLCRYPKTNPTKEEDVRVKRETEAAIVEARRHILEAHAERLTAELAEGR